MASQLRFIPAGSTAARGMPRGHPHAGTPAACRTDADGQGTISRSAVPDSRCRAGGHDKGRRMAGSRQPRYAFRASCSGEVPVMAGPGNEMAAGAGARGHLRASHADREQVIGTLKAAFVQGMLAKDELNARVGQALAARTYADLATLIADL